MSVNDLMHEFYQDHADTLASSITANGNVTNPAAGAAIASTESLAPGTWDVAVYTAIFGTTADSDRSNMNIKFNGAVVAVPINATDGTVSRINLRVQADSNSPLSVNAVSAVASGAGYISTIVANRIA